MVSRGVPVLPQRWCLDLLTVCLYAVIAQDAITVDRPKGREGAGVRVSGTKRIEVPREHVTQTYGGEAGAVVGVPPDRSAGSVYATRFPARVPYYVDALHPDTPRETSHLIEDVLRGDVSYEDFAIAHQRSVDSESSVPMGVRGLVGASDRTPVRPSAPDSAAVVTGTGVSGARPRPGRRIATYKPQSSGEVPSALAPVRADFCRLLCSGSIIFHCANSLTVCVVQDDAGYERTPTGQARFGSFPPPSPIRPPGVDGDAGNGGDAGTAKRVLLSLKATKDSSDETRLPTLASARPPGADGSRRSTVQTKSVTVKWSSASQTL